jgi:sulfite dehydrogenase (cytochrome) subunit B
MSRAALAIALAACATIAHARAIADVETFDLIDAPGRDVTATSCVTCHSLDYIRMNAPVMNRGSWEKTIRKMVDKFGAPIKQDDADQILEYLTRHYSG